MKKINHIAHFISKSLSIAIMILVAFSTVNVEMSIIAKCFVCFGVFVASLLLTFIVSKEVLKRLSVTQRDSIYEVIKE